MAENWVTSKDDRNEEDVRRRIHPPSKKQCDQQIEGINQKITALESKLKSLKTQPSDNVSPSATLDRDSNAVLNKLREEKEKKMKNRKEMEENLRTMTNAISRKTDELSKKRARLPAKSVDKLESMIRKLEYQLQRNHFTIKEETRIVHEIDSLKRSKKTLREYIVEKEELDGEIAKKNKLRAARDKLFNEISGLNEEEKKVKRQLKELRSQANTEYSNIKKEIDELYNQKRKVTANFKAEMKQFYERRAMHFEQNEQQKIQREARHKEFIKQKLKEQMSEPFAEKLKACKTLLTYLHRCTNDTPDMSGHNVFGQDRSGLLVNTVQDGATASVPAGTSLSPSSSFNEDVGRIIHRKKNEEDEWMFAGNVTRMKKKQAARIRNRKASWMNKSISHPPDIFRLFSELGITAPSSVGDINEVVNQIQKLKQQYEDCSRKQRSDTGNTGIDSGTASSSECYSPSNADMVPDFKTHRNQQKLSLTDSTQLANDEDDDEIDSVFDDTTENIEYVAEEDDDSFQQEGFPILPKPSHEKPNLKLRIAPKNHTFETSQSLPNKNEGQNLLRVAAEGVSPNDDKLVSLSDSKLPDDIVLKLGTNLSSLSICESEETNSDDQSLVAPEMQEEMQSVLSEGESTKSF